MTLSRDEVRERLAGLARGPWADAVVEARRDLAAAGKLKVSGTRTLSLDGLKLSAADKRKSAKLRVVLRPHFEDKAEIRKPEEIETRDTFDQALMLPQLYELAVQTGYLPAASVRQPARKLLTELLWSAPARRFVDSYDYVAVPMLAARVDVAGLAAIEPPEPNPNASMRFAGFLAHLHAFSDDQLIQTWTHFLDDYVVERGEQDQLWEYLRGKRQKPPRRAEELMAGCQRFVTSLASAFHVLDDDELGRFGLMHAYWLQKFFGYEMKGTGYVKQVGVWGKEDSWARTFSGSSRLVPKETDSKIADLIKRQFVDQVALLERTFGAVRSLAMSSRTAAKRGARLPHSSSVEQPSKGLEVAFSASARPRRGAVKMAASPRKSAMERG